MRKPDQHCLQAGGNPSIFDLQGTHMSAPTIKTLIPASPVLGLDLSGLLNTVVLLSITEPRQLHFVAVYFSNSVYELVVLTTCSCSTSGTLA